MSYEDGYEKVEIDGVDSLEEVHLIAVHGLMREGEFRFRERLIETLQNEIATYKEEVDHEPNLDWINGLSWCIQIVKNLKPEEY